MTRPGQLDWIFRREENSWILPMSPFDSWNNYMKDLNEITAAEFGFLMVGYTQESARTLSTATSSSTLPTPSKWEKSHPFFDKGAAVAEEVAADLSNPEEIAEAIGAALDNRPSKYIRDERGRIVRPSGATP